MEKKEKRRAMMLSFGLHTVLLLLAIFPLVSMVSKTDVSKTETYQYIEIEFEHGDMSPSSASSKPGDKAETEVDIDVELIPKVLVETAQEETTVLKNEEVSEFEEISIEMEQGTQEADVPVGDKEQDEIGADNSFNEETGLGSESEGEGEVGEEITGLSLSNMDFEGDGVFGRKIIYHANISKLAKEEGRVVVNLCINRAGNVTHVAFNKEASSITNPVYIRKVMSVAGKYRFEADYTAPKTQCGKLTFIFEFN